MDISSRIQEHIEVIETLQSQIATIEQIAIQCAAALENGKKILLVGNGGSAADAQHIAAELVGRFLKRRKGLAAIALTTDTSAITAISNDFGFEKVFSRQVEALGHEGDVLIAISTSGNSENIIQAVIHAKMMGIETIGLLGNDGGQLKKICNFNIIVHSEVTARIQEAHILIGHILCEYIEEV
jgi:D-sedoheptulose 7-phosphate isomerase